MRLVADGGWIGVCDRSSSSLVGKIDLQNL
jgi:hypothetical protein